jgi:integration host factor subunit alpha
MTQRTVTRAELSEAAYQRIGLSRSESSALVELVLDEISSSLAVGNSVKLSSFGSFLVRDKGQRVGRNPKTGVEVPIEPRRVMVFKPSNIMKARVNGLDALDASDD